MKLNEFKEIFDQENELSQHCSEKVLDIINSIPYQSFLENLGTLYNRNIINKVLTILKFSNSIPYRLAIFESTGLTEEHYEDFRYLSLFVAVTHKGLTDEKDGASFKDLKLKKDVRIGLQNFLRKEIYYDTHNGTDIVFNKRRKENGDEQARFYYYDDQINSISLQIFNYLENFKNKLKKDNNKSEKYVEIINQLTNDRGYHVVAELINWRINLDIKESHMALLRNSQKEFQHFTGEAIKSRTNRRPSDN